MHNEKRSTWYKEGALTLLTGFLYGGSNTLVGHPFDTVKTKMQAQAGHMSGENRGPKYVETISKIFKAEGPVGFYRGWIPPFFGSVIYRSAQFSAFESFYTKCEDFPWTHQPIPFSGGLQYRVFFGGVAGATLRALIECPFEYAKVKRQTGQSWQVKHIYKGFSNLLPRTTGMMTWYFCTVDTMRRWTGLWDYKIGQFLISGGAAMTGFWIIWPLEVLKNLAQADNKLAGSTTGERVHYIWKTQGLIGFYRGIMPGSQSVFLRNGAAMIVMQYANRKITEAGWRE